VLLRLYSANTVRLDEPGNASPFPHSKVQASATTGASPHRQRSIPDGADSASRGETTRDESRAALSVDEPGLLPSLAAAGLSPPSASALLLLRPDQPEPSCARRWKLGGCRYCPSWAEVGELWRATAEARRAGGWVALSPSVDEEWARAVARAALVVAKEEREHDDMEGRDGGASAMGGPTGDIRRGGTEWSQQLLTEWWGAAHSAPACAELRGGARHSERCLAAHWEAMLCSE
jgi:hypothetical protein